MFRAIFYFLFYMFLGYILIKTFRYLKDVFFGSPNSNTRVQDSQHKKSPIDNKDIIEADFEEIDEKNNSDKADAEK